MKNNIHEDKSLNDKVKEFHTKLVEGLDLPKWMSELECPFCKAKLTAFSIRGLNFKTNPRNFGDLCIDFMCEACKSGDNLYLRKVFDTRQDIALILNGFSAHNKPIDPKAAFVEKTMYSMCYNNAIEKMLGGQNGNAEKG